MRRSIHTLQCLRCLWTYHIYIMYEYDYGLCVVPVAYLHESVVVNVYPPVYSRCTLMTKSHGGCIVLVILSAVHLQRG